MSIDCCRWIEKNMMMRGSVDLLGKSDYVMLHESWTVHD
jgi:hypothetical protein